MNLSQLNELWQKRKEFSTIQKEELPFYGLLFLSVFLWMVDAASTRALVWKFGTDVELNPLINSEYMRFGDGAISLFTGRIILMHTLNWAIYKIWPMFGWFTLMASLALTGFTNYWNFFIMMPRMVF